MNFFFWLSEVKILNYMSNLKYIKYEYERADSRNKFLTECFSFLKFLGGTLPREEMY